MKSLSSFHRGVRVLYTRVCVWNTERQRARAPESKCVYVCVRVCVCVCMRERDLVRHLSPLKTA